MEQQRLTVTDIVPFGIIATIFPALELWVIFGMNSSVMASLVYWLVYGLVVYGSSFGLWYWLIVNQTSRENKKVREE